MRVIPSKVEFFFFKDRVVQRETETGRQAQVSPSSLQEADWNQGLRTQSGLSKRVAGT